MRVVTSRVNSSSAASVVAMGAKEIATARQIQELNIARNVTSGRG